MNNEVFDLLVGLAADKRFLSVLIVVSILVVRFVWVRQIRGRADILTEQQRRWIARVKNGAITVMLFSLILLWLPELERFALSIAAFVVAIVIATKELIMCVGGTILRATTGAYSVGDWVELGPYRGEVLDYNLFSTTLLELDPTHRSYDFTGKTIVMPKSVLLSQPCKNMNFMHSYVFHSFTVVTEPDINPFDARDFVLQRFEVHARHFF